MRTNGFSTGYPYPKLDSVEAISTTYGGTKRYQITTVNTVQIIISSENHKNVCIGLERKEAQKLVKELNRILRIKRKLR